MRASRTKELRATTLLDMGGLLLWDLWVTVWPVIKNPLDAGFAVPASRLEMALDAIHTRIGFVMLAKYCENESYWKKIYDYLGRYV
ncbi:hypothetical protein LJC27_07845 [Christensenellaceae bacterium OttesenSCG-928-M15]|nr:hypothetical protein [Christensenellaceae bacterium OttesenSCG-928-M15]